MANLYRADHVGSLLRPPELLRAREQYFAGQLTSEQLLEQEDHAILGALELQRSAGVDVLSDGEYRRTSFVIDSSKAYEGVAPAARENPGWQGGDAQPLASEMVGLTAVAKLRRVGQLVGDEASFLRQHVTGPYKVTMPTANQLASFLYREGVSKDAYPSQHDLALELADFLRHEIQELIDEGTPYIQIDTPSYTQFCDAQYVQGMRDRGLDPEQVLNQWIAVDNRTLAGLRREGVTIGMHLCRGNSRGRWLSQGGYEPVAEKLFNGVDVDRFSLEYDTERAGGFEPLRFMPRNKQVVLGLITTKEGRLEQRDELVRSIEAAAAHAPLENMALSPQCGFSTNALGNPITMDDQRKKLAVLVETARQVWG